MFSVKINKSEGTLVLDAESELYININNVLHAGVIIGSVGFYLNRKYLKYCLICYISISKESKPFGASTPKCFLSSVSILFSLSRSAMATIEAST